MTKIASILIMNLLVVFAAAAQYKFQPVFPGQKGQVLLTNLVSAYKPAVVLDYSTARDTLFFRVYRENDSLACIYSDHKLPLPDGYDPTTVVYLNGTANGINTEHAYPQSKGAVGGAKSDMHHLYATRGAVNEARGNLPYGESPDNQTQKWFYKTIELTSKPLVNIDLYAELNATVFEPREKVKGDLARSVFYFYTMYKAEADAADHNFFNIQKNTLCQWHLLDPVDSLEWVRNDIIAKYQGGSKNPYILDCTLPFRTFCPDYLPACDTTVDTKIVISQKELKIYPVPFSSEITICAQAEFSKAISITISDLIGRVVLLKSTTPFGNCIEISDEQLRNLRPGVYFLTISSNSDSAGNYFTKTIIKQ
ncbi:MAG: endonuclease [Saprospiraceae bacterium]|nr:endonuclease [Saprospiraceae bacterium]